LVGQSEESGMLLPASRIARNADQPSSPEASSRTIGS
jgi:hypothetical protein